MTDGQPTQYESRIVGWCSEGLIWDEYKGPKTGCPQEGCLDGRDHYLRKRRALVCPNPDCRIAYVSSKPPLVCLHNVLDFV